jgi:hypothetical protein
VLEGGDPGGERLGREGVAQAVGAAERKDRGSTERLRFAQQIQGMSDDVISRYRQRRAADAAETRRGIADQLAAQGLRSPAAKPRLATAEEMGNAWMHAAVDIARRRGTGRLASDEQSEEA